MGSSAHSYCGLFSSSPFQIVLGKKAGEEKGRGWDIGLWREVTCICELVYLVLNTNCVYFKCQRNLDMSSDLLRQNLVVYRACCGRYTLWKAPVLKGKWIKHRGNGQLWCSRYVGVFCTGNYKKKPQVLWFSDWLNLDGSLVVGKRACEKPKVESVQKQFCREHCTWFCCAEGSRCTAMLPKEHQCPRAESAGSNQGP